jgi:hypothetical protein
VNANPGDYLDDTHRAISEFAEAFLEEDERGDFVDGLMERHGYERTSSWAPPAQQPGGQGARQPLLKQRQQGGQRGGQGQQQGGQGQQRQGSYFRK